MTEPGTTPGHLSSYRVALNADIVDYSAHMADDPAGTVEGVQSLHRIVEDIVESAGGRVLDFVGDNVMAVFTSATDAIGASVAICRSVRRRNENLAPAHRMTFRIGLDSGDIREADDGLYGDPLNIAARVQALAPKGGINVSEHVFVDLDEPRLRFEPLGAQRLKNIPELVAVYRLSGVGEDQHAPTTNDENPTVAVLPISAHHTTAELDGIGDAIRSDLLHALVQVPRLTVIDARESANSTGAEPVARYMIQSGVHQSGDRLRAYVTVIDVESINPVWAGKWEGTVAGLFDLQDQITSDVIKGVEIELVVGEPARLYRELTDRASIERVYRGWDLITSGTPSAARFREAIDNFEGLVADHPKVPVGPALTSFAYWYGEAIGLFDDPAEATDRARHYAHMGVDQDDPTGLSHMVLAALRLMDGEGLDEAFELAKDAITRRPTCDVTFGVEAAIERYRGNWDRGVEAARRAIELSPMIRGWHAANLAGCLYGAGRHREAADVAQPIVDTSPASLDAHLILAGAQQALGLSRRAAATAGLVAERFPDLDLDRFSQRQPYADKTIMIRWRADLAACGIE